MEHKCEYCGKTHKESEMVQVNIRVNGWPKKGWYCNEQCAAYAQMGAEG